MKPLPPKIKSKELSAVIKGEVVGCGSAALCPC